MNFHYFVLKNRPLENYVIIMRQSSSPFSISVGSLSSLGAVACDLNWGRCLPLVFETLRLSAKRVKAWA